MIVVRDIIEADAAAWRRLWAGYTAFYEADVPAAVTDATWSRLLDRSAPILGRVAERGQQVVGFSICVLHPGTWTTAPICYLEDLFVDPAQRRGGIGRALIQDLIDRGRAQGWSRLYWHTHGSNAAARRVYDTFAAADGFVRYRLFLD